MDWTEIIQEFMLVGWSGFLVSHRDEGGDSDGCERRRRSSSASFLNMNESLVTFSLWFVDQAWIYREGEWVSVLVWTIWADAGEFLEEWMKILMMGWRCTGRSHAHTFAWLCDYGQCRWLGLFSQACMQCLIFLLLLGRTTDKRGEDLRV